MPFGRQRLLPGPGACPRSSAGALKTDIDSDWFLYLTSGVVDL